MLGSNTILKVLEDRQCASEALGISPTTPMYARYFMYIELSLILILSFRLLSRKYALQYLRSISHLQKSVYDLRSFTI